MDGNEWFVSRLRAEVRALQRDVRALYVLVFVIFIWLSASLLSADDYGDALADQASHPGAAYLSLEPLHPELHEQAVAAMKFATASMTRVVSLDSVLPERVTDTLYRIYPDRLRWGNLYDLLHEQYPYGLNAETVVIRADWFVTLLDQSSGIDVYHELLFGKKIKTLEEFFGEVGVVKRSPEAYGWIEEQSRVAVSKVRLIQTRPTTGRHDCWSTYDSARIGVDHDPLENLLGGLQYDASEHIALLAKSINGTIGHLQAYAIANSAGEIQSKAPADVAVDIGTRGVEVRNSISCVVCHSGGLNLLSESGLRAYIGAGAELYVEPAKRAEVERLYLVDLQRLIRSANESYADTVALITAQSPSDAAQSVLAVVEAYDSPLTFEDVRREMGASDGHLTGVISTLTSSARLAILPSRTMPRATFEDVFSDLSHALNTHSDSGSR